MQEHAGQRRLRTGAARAARGGGGKAAAIRPTARAKQGGVALFVEKLGPVARSRACMHALCPLSAASIKAVTPLAECRSGLAECCSRRSTMDG